MRKTALIVSLALILLVMLAGSLGAQTRIENGTVTTQNAVASYQIDIDATTITVTIETVGSWSEVAFTKVETVVGTIKSYNVELIGPGAE